MDNLQNNPVLVPIFQEVEQIIGKDTYELWFKEAQFIYESPILTVILPNAVWKKTIEERYQRIITDAFLKHLGTEIQISYQIIDKAPTTTNIKEFLTPTPRVNPFAQRLNSEFTFENFVESPSNRFACKAAETVSNKLGSKGYNPLVIFAAPGLGKTHLLHAIGNQILKNNPQAKVLYVSGEDFVSEYILSLQNKSSNDFRQKYHTLDCLLMDDIQAVVGKKACEQEFFFIFNKLFGGQKQIVLSSDRTPQQLEMEERLSSRLLSGVVTEIKRPDLETRIAILRKKSEAINFTLGDDVIFLIAEGIQTSVRELEGALNRLRAWCLVNRIVPSIPVAKEILSDMLVDEDHSFVSVTAIKKIVGKHFSVKMEDFNSKKKNQTIAWPRQIAMYLTTTMTDLSLPEIGREFNRDHSTVVHARDLVKDKINTDPFFTAEINQIISEIKAVDNK